ncbi:MAG: glycerol-3-phosphate acyltransferase [Lacunisphaera sp.]|nr:glycerol-3-phosphate acyltransferase [Lacunisphaera sp.]
MSVVFLKMLLGYLLGSISGSLWLGRLRGVDIRTKGSGNAGGTNAFRTQGPWFGLGVGLIDVGKGALAAWFGGLGLAGEAPSLTVALLTGAAAAAGHVWPLYHGFRGGKGVAVVIGVLLVLWPAALAVLAAVLLLVLTTTGYVGLGSILAGAALIPAAVWLAPEGERTVWIVATGLIAGFILFTHRANVQRLRARTEHRFERARILARLFAPRG